MNKYDAFIKFCEKIIGMPIEKTDLSEYFEEFEIAWESGEFNEESKGECCNG